MKFAVVTGASRGIGRAVALALGARGLDLVAVSRTQAGLDETAAWLHVGGRRAMTVSCDVGSAVEVQRLAEQVAAWGAPDVIVHCAGVIRRAHIEEMTEADWDVTLDTNLKGVFLVTRAFLPGMKARRSGRIVVVGSISSTLGTARASAYCASKWGVVGFTKALAEEVRKTGIMVSGILPGSVDTDMLKGSGFSPEMTPEEVSRAIVFLALDAPDSMNGSVVEMFGR